MGSSTEDADRLLNCFRRGFSACNDHADEQPRPKLHYSSPSSPLPSAASTRKKLEIAPGVFYGSPLGKPAKHNPLRLLQELHGDRSGTHNFTTRLAPGKSSSWVTFARQEKAIEYAAAAGAGVAVFTYQDHVSGQRRFLATSYEEFWTRYEKMQPNVRHHYEIIRDKAPCHLYFDVEFNRNAASEDVDGDLMIDLLLEIVGATLLDIFSLSYSSAWTLELDSSTKDKFSRHLIIRIPKTAFKDNSHAGAFVAEICTRIHTLRGSETRLQHLYVLDDADPPKLKLFVDQAVYSRNRSFRLVFSAKAGKTALLLPTYRFISDNTIMDDASIFMRSLICKMDDDCETLLTFSCQQTPTGQARSQTTLREPAVNPQSVGGGASPFEELDKFIHSISCGKIRNWYWFSELGMMVYNISGNRFCERIGRQHKSNNVMYIVDLPRAGYYQKCHDPDCRGYKSPLRSVPCHALPPSVNTQEDIERVEEGDDDAWWQEIANFMDN